MHLTIPDRRLRHVFTASALGLGSTSTWADSLFEPPTTLEVAATEIIAPAPGLRTEFSASHKLPAPLFDTPQTITVIPAPLIANQQALGLRQVLSNVSGITFNAGEGGGGSGDSISIRGFSADSNLLLDGLRDTAQTTRSDTFNTEQVEVIKGPNSVFAGAGTTGGSINVISKEPAQRAFTQLSTGLGSDHYQRLTLDTNQPLQNIGDNSAVRLNLMQHKNQVPGRDSIRRERWGVAPSLSLGLNESTRLTLSASHQVDDNLPDYGVPALDGRRLTGVERDAYFGLQGLDKEEVEHSLFTLKLEHDFNDEVRLLHMNRYSRLERDTVVSAAQVETRGLPAGRYRPAGPQGYGRDATTELWMNQTSLIGNARWLNMTHDWVAGVELSRETLDLETYNHGLDKTSYPANGYALGNPPGHWSGHLARTTTRYNENTLDAYALYVFDTIALDERWDLHLGLRQDHLVGKTAAYSPAHARTSAFKTSDSVLSSRAGLIYKPNEIGRIYVSWGNSFDPTVESLTGNGRGLDGDTQVLSPERSQAWELGSKWALLEHALELDAALFHIVKHNARETLSDGSTQLSGKQRVQGLEVGLTGRLSPQWNVFANFTFLDSQVLAAAPGNASSARKGQALANTPPRSLNLWTTYELNDAWTLGYGAHHVSRRNVTSSTNAKLDAFWLHNAMLNYRVEERFDIQLNVNNLFNKTYVERVRQRSGSAARSSAIEYGDARAAVVTASYHF